MLIMIFVPAVFHKWCGTISFSFMCLLVRDLCCGFICCLISQTFMYFIP